MRIRYQISSQFTSLSLSLNHFLKKKNSFFTYPFLATTGFEPATPDSKSDALSLRLHGPHACDYISFT